MPCLLLFATMDMIAESGSSYISSLTFITLIVCTLRTMYIFKCGEGIIAIYLLLLVLLKTLTCNKTLRMNFGLNFSQNYILLDMFRPSRMIDGKQVTLIGC